MIEIRGSSASAYQDIFTHDAIEALHALAPLDNDRKAIMAARMTRRSARARSGERIAFLDAAGVIPRTRIPVAKAREGAFVGSDIPHDLQRQ